MLSVGTTLRGDPRSPSAASEARAPSAIPGMAPLVPENDDAFGPQEHSGVSHALGAVVLLSDGQYDLASHNLVHGRAGTAG